MSRLLDRIKKQSETPTAQMGFRKTDLIHEKPTILLIAKVTITDPGITVDIIEGADAVLLDFTVPEFTLKSLKKTTERLNETPWGIIQEQSAIEGDKLESTGYDFVLLTPASPISSAPKNEKTGKIIQVESSLDDGLILSLNSLPVDAVLADDTFGEGGTMSYHHLMMMGYMAMMVRKPLIVATPLSIARDELKALWDAGVEAVLVTVDTAKGENLKELHDMASSLPPRTADKQKKSGVLLPRAGAKQSPPPPDEEGDE